MKLGRIGFEGRYDYGALGAVTNLAARLSDQAQRVRSVGETRFPPRTPRQDDALPTS